MLLSRLPARQKDRRNKDDQAIMQGQTWQGSRRTTSVGVLDRANGQFVWPYRGLVEGRYQYHCGLKVSELQTESQGWTSLSPCE